jgi:hypothetical protein
VHPPAPQHHHPTQLHAQQHAPVTPYAEDDDDDGGGKKRDNRQGASCHQCKTTKDEQHLLFCTTKAGTGRKRRCRKKYVSSTSKQMESFFALEFFAGLTLAVVFGFV